MALKILYVASDGTQFDTEEKAEQYEDLLENRKKGEEICGWTQAGEEIHYENEDFIDIAFVVYIAHEEALGRFRCRCDEEGTEYMGIDEPGVYYWNIRKGIYENVEEIIDTCRNKIDLVSLWLKKAKEKGWRNNG